MRARLLLLSLIARPILFPGMRYFSTWLVLPFSFSSPFHFNWHFSFLVNYSCLSFFEIMLHPCFSFSPLQALALAKQALVAENISQQGSGLFPVGPEYLEVRS